MLPRQAREALSHSHHPATTQPRTWAGRAGAGHEDKVGFGAAGQRLDPVHLQLEALGRGVKHALPRLRHRLQHLDAGLKAQAQVLDVACRQGNRAGRPAGLVRRG